MIVFCYGGGFKSSSITRLSEIRHEVRSVWLQLHLEAHPEVCDFLFLTIFLGSSKEIVLNW